MDLDNLVRFEKYAVYDDKEGTSFTVVFDEYGNYSFMNVNIKKAERSDLNLMQYIAIELEQEFRFFNHSLIKRDLVTQIEAISLMEKGIVIKSKVGKFLMIEDGNVFIKNDISGWNKYNFTLFNVNEKRYLPLTEEERDKYA